jgi:hypothetical protein
MSVEDAMLGFKCMRGHTLAIITTKPEWRSSLLRRDFDAANLQCFIPGSVRVR